MRRALSLPPSWDAVILTFACVLTNATAFSFTPQFFDPPVNRQYGVAIASLALLLVALVLGALAATRRLRISAADVRGHALLWAFVAFSAASLLWTIEREITGIELALMFSATFLGVHLAGRMDPSRGGVALRVVGAVFVALSLVLLLTTDAYSRLSNYPYYGAWRGAFWHRNHMGTLMAFFAALGLLGALSPGANTRARVTGALLFAAAAVLLLGSRSATGMLVLAALSGLVVTATGWMWIHPRMKRRHYVVALIVLAALITFAAFNLDTIFALVGRETTLTGRTALWQHLLTAVWPQKPVSGFGFGALWNQWSFRQALAARLGWGEFPPFFGDNGFIDILLNLGALGLLLFAAFYVLTGYRALRFFLRGRSSAAFVPLLIWSFVGMANIAYSFLFEVDQFVWMLLVMAAVWAERGLGRVPAEVGS